MELLFLTVTIKYVCEDLSYESRMNSDTIFFFLSCVKLIVQFDLDRGDLQESLQKLMWLSLEINTAIL